MNGHGNTRQQVMAEIIAVMVQAEAAGEDAFDVARRSFPGVPSLVLGEAYAEVIDDEAEAWWRTIERTIDGEVIRAAIAGPASKPAPAGSWDAHLDEAFAALTETDVDERRGR